MTNFYNDYDKMLDFKELNKEEFLLSYGYITSEEYDETERITNEHGGVNSYEVSKHILNIIRKENEIIFRMAISHLMDVGIRHLTPECVEETCKEINEEDDTHSIMTNEFKCHLIWVAAQIARIDHIHLLIYISHYVQYDCNQKEINYQRMRGIAASVIYQIECEHDELSTTYEILANECEIEDNELSELGYDYLVHEYEEEI